MRDFLQNTVLGDTPLERWAIALGLAAVAILILQVIWRVLLRQARRLSTASSNKVDDLFVTVLATTAWFGYLAVALYVGSIPLRLGAAAQSGVRSAVVTLILVQAGIWAQAGTRAVVDQWISSKPGNHNTTAGAAITFVATLVVWTAVVLMGLSNLGVEITTVIAGLGVGGVAAALAVQNVLTDVIASLSMYLDRPFDIGDFIIVGDYMGTVTKIGVRTTRVQALGGEELIFPNGDLARSRIQNYARMSERRVVFGFGIEYGLPPEKLEKASELAQQIVTSAPNVRFDRAHFKSYGASSLDYEVVYYVLSPDYNQYMDIQHSINMQLYKQFNLAEIPFAFPTQTVFMRSAETVPREP